MATYRTNLNAVLGRIDTLPAMPEIARKLLKLSLDTHQGEAEMLRLIEREPRIAAKIIGLSNTSLFYSPVKVSSVSDAAMILGLTRVKSVVIGIASMSALVSSSEGKLRLSSLWVHSMAITLTMRVIAKCQPASDRPDDEQIFLAGLLHDIGYLVINYLYRPLSDKLHERLESGDADDLLDIEQEIVGMSHAEIGALLGEHWNLPESITEVIKYHHNPADSASAQSNPLLKLIYFAEKMLSAIGIAEHTANEMTEQEWKDLGIDLSKVETIETEVAEVMAQAEQLAIAG